MPLNFGEVGYSYETAVAVNTPDILLLRKDLENHHYTELRGKSLD
jgi:hypothetical protein